MLLYTIRYYENSIFGATWRNFRSKLNSYEIRFYLHAGLLYRCMLAPPSSSVTHKQDSNVFIVLHRTTAKRNVLFSFVKNIVRVVGSDTKTWRTFFYRFVIDSASIISRRSEYRFFYFTLLTSIYLTWANWWKLLALF